MLTNIVGCAPDEVKIGMPVEVTFEDVSDEVAIPRFSPKYQARRAEFDAEASRRLARRQPSEERSRTRGRASTARAN